MPYEGVTNGGRRALGASWVGTRDLRRRTPGEGLWLWRRSLDLTQAQAAAVHKVSERRYNYWETDREEADPAKPVACSTGKGDLCALARRRDGRPLRELAAALGAGSHVTLLAWEASAEPRLVAAWRRLGYRF